MSSIPREPSSKSRVLGAELRDVRTRAGLTCNQLGDRLGWSTAKVSRMETGARGADPTDVASFAATCGVVGKELHRLVNLSASPADGYWVQANGEPMPDELRALVFLETTATGIASYAPHFVPGLVQTESYIRALFREGGFIPEDRMEARVRARLARQRLLCKPEPPVAQFYIHEHVLRTPVGSAGVMQNQLLHLRTLSLNGRCQIRIVPASAGARASSLMGNFVVFDHENSSTVYVEQLTTSLFLDSPIDIEVYGTALRSLAACALGEQESQGVLARLASRYSPRR